MQGETVTHPHSQQFVSELLLCWILISAKNNSDLKTKQNKNKRYKERRQARYMWWQLPAWETNKQTKMQIKYCEWLHTDLPESQMGINGKLTPSTRRFGFGKFSKSSTSCLGSCRENTHWWPLFPFNRMQKAILICAQPRQGRMHLFLFTCLLVLYLSHDIQQLRKKTEMMVSGKEENHIPTCKVFRLVCEWLQMHEQIFGL